MIPRTTSSTPQQQPESTPTEIQTAAGMPLIYLNIPSEYDAFLMWDEDDTWLGGPPVNVFDTLTAMVKDGYPFNDALATKASVFLNALTPPHLHLSAEELLCKLLPGHVNPVDGFVEAHRILTASSDVRIVESAVHLLAEILTECSYSLFKRLMNRDVVAETMNMIKPRLVELGSGEPLHARAIDLLTSTISHVINPAFSEEKDAPYQSLTNDEIITKHLCPYQPFIHRLWQNRCLIPDGQTSDSILELFSGIIRVLTFQKSMLDFVQTCHIVPCLASYMTFFNTEFVTRFSLNFRQILREWRRAGSPTSNNGKIIVTELNSEGFEDVLEQPLFPINPECSYLSIKFGANKPGADREFR